METSLLKRRRRQAKVKILQPFTSNGDDFIWVKYSRTGRQTICNQLCLILWLTYNIYIYTILFSRLYFFLATLKSDIFLNLRNGKKVCCSRYQLNITTGFCESMYYNSILIMADNKILIYVLSNICENFLYNLVSFKQNHKF